VTEFGLWFAAAGGYCWGWPVVRVAGKVSVGGGSVHAMMKKGFFKTWARRDDGKTDGRRRGLGNDEERRFTYHSLYSIFGTAPVNEAGTREPCPHLF
jgi:hypothetical protein